MSYKRIFQASFDHPLNGEVVEIVESGLLDSIVRHCNRLHKVPSVYLYAITAAITAADTSEEVPDTIASNLLKAHGSNNTHAEILSNLEYAVCTLLWQAQIALTAAPDKDAAMNAILEVNSLREQVVQRLQEIER